MKKLLLTLLISTSLIGTSQALTFVNNNSLLDYVDNETTSPIENIPRNDPVPEGVMYRGINEEQWKIIEKKGDPLNCRKKVYDFQQITDYHVVSPEDCKKNRHCIQHALDKNQHVKLKEGDYKIYNIIDVDDKVLTGENGNVNINAEEVDTAIKVSNGTLANLNINFANDVAVNVKHNSLVYRVVAGNTGVESLKTTKGYGFIVWNVGSYTTSLPDSDWSKCDNGSSSNKFQYTPLYCYGDDNKLISKSERREKLTEIKEEIKEMNTFKSCLVSLESFNGYNEATSSSLKKGDAAREVKGTPRGGNADGFEIKYGAWDVTLIDTHAHHNSDDGYDFWKGGIESKTPVIRLFYASANFNGKHPTRSNGDGNGFKFGSPSRLQKDKGIDKGARLIYGSAACGNKRKGFDRNGSPTKIIGINLNAAGNKKGFKDVSNAIHTPLDPHRLKCSMFPTQ